MLTSNKYWLVIERNILDTAAFRWWLRRTAKVSAERIENTYEATKKFKSYKNRPSVIKKPLSQFVSWFVYKHVWTCCNFEGTFRQCLTATLDLWLYGSDTSTFLAKTISLFRRMMRSVNCTGSAVWLALFVFIYNEANEKFLFAIINNFA